MSPPIPRRFTLIDAMVLIAAAAIALVLMRPVLQGMPSVVHSPTDVLHLGMSVCILIEPLALTWSLALGLLRLRKPRPRLRRVFRQPGMAACTATFSSNIMFILILLIIASIHYFSLRRFAFGEFFQFTDDDAWLVLMSFTGWAVCGAWTVLWLAGAWRAERSWMDRTGRVLGVYWILNSVIGLPVLFS
jgi:hypothetical protein